MFWLILSLLSGCDDTEFPSHVPDGPADDGFAGVMEIFDSSCAGCHGPQGSFPDLVTDPCGDLVDQPSQAYSGVLVAPGDAEASVLWHKMENTGDFGGIMPAGASEPLPEATRQVLTDWINDGALCEEADADTGTDADTDTDTDTDTDADTDADVDDVFYSDLYPSVEAQCAGCHGDGGAGGLELNDESESYNTLTTASSSTGMAYIDLGAPTSSYLYMKVSADPGITGGAMPDADGMEPAESDLVLTWIEQGARP